MNNKKSVLQPKWNTSSTSPRFLQLQKFFKGKDVLDIGCAVGYRKTNWMHKNIISVARNVLGLDIDKEAIANIKEMGYEIRHEDACNFDLGKKFELIHAGELIEHLENPGGFLRCVHEHLTNDGFLLMTTPNALRVSNFIYAATGGLRVNDEHTCWFCEYTIKTLLERTGFEVVEVGYLAHTTSGVFRKLALKLRTVLLPQRVAWNTLYVLAKIRA